MKRLGVFLVMVSAIGFATLSGCDTGTNGGPADNGNNTSDTGGTGDTGSDDSSDDAGGSGSN